MSFVTQFDQSNTADWIIDISADAYDGSGNLIGPFDFTGANVLFAVKDDNDCIRLSASIGSGITQPSGTVLEVRFTPAQMATLSPGSYKVGCVCQLNGEIDPILVGTVSVYDGVAQL